MKYFEKLVFDGPAFIQNYATGLSIGSVSATVQGTSLAQKPGFVVGFTQSVLVDASNWPRFTSSYVADGSKYFKSFTVEQATLLLSESLANLFVLGTFVLSYESGRFSINMDYADSGSVTGSTLKRFAPGRYLLSLVAEPTKIVLYVNGEIALSLEKDDRPFAPTSQGYFDCGGTGSFFLSSVAYFDRSCPSTEIAARYDTFATALRNYAITGGIRWSFGLDKFQQAHEDIVDLSSGLNSGVVATATDVRPVLDDLGGVVPGSIEYIVPTDSFDSAPVVIVDTIGVGDYNINSSKYTQADVINMISEADPTAASIVLSINDLANTSVTELRATVLAGNNVHADNAEREIVSTDPLDSIGKSDSVLVFASDQGFLFKDANFSTTLSIPADAEYGYIKYIDFWMTPENVADGTIVSVTGKSFGVSGGVWSSTFDETYVNGVLGDLSSITAGEPAHITLVSSTDITDDVVFQQGGLSGIKFYCITVYTSHDDASKIYERYFLDEVLMIVDDSLTTISESKYDIYAYDWIRIGGN